MSVAGPALQEIVVAAHASAWRDAGFRVGGDQAAVVDVGTVAIGLAGAGAGRRVVRCGLSGIRGESFDGLPIVRKEARVVEESAPPHPNGVVRIDHLVVFTPDLDRTVAAGETLGLDLRRIRDEPAPAGSPRQAFFRLGELLLEVAQAPAGSPLAGDSPARFYGLAFVVEDLDATAAALGELCGEPHDAVQPGRRIATFRKEADLGLPVALMTPRPSSAPAPPVPHATG
ncbi:MAG TPA: VOC family protein [Thermoleophilaceae bacterium]|nr:VOC family protein [Thermoleophilaceae bacterium]